MGHMVKANAGQSAHSAVPPMSTSEPQLLLGDDQGTCPPSYLTNDSTEAQRGKVTHSRLHAATKQQASRLDLGPPAPRPAIFPWSHCSARGEAQEMFVG